MESGIELHNGVKAIWCKGVFEIKKVLLGNSERYKARLVTKEFTQKEEIWLERDFSLLFKKDYPHIIMHLLPGFNLELH